MCLRAGDGDADAAGVAAGEPRAVGRVAAIRRAARGQRGSHAPAQPAALRQLPLQARRAHGQQARLGPFHCALVKWVFTLPGDLWRTAIGAGVTSAGLNAPHNILPSSLVVAIYPMLGPV